MICPGKKISNIFRKNMHCDHLATRLLSIKQKLNIFFQLPDFTMVAA